MNRGRAPLSYYAPEKYRAIIVACVEGNAPVDWFAKFLGLAETTVRSIVRKERSLRMLASMEPGTTIM